MSMYAGKVGRAVGSGVKRGDDYGGPRLLGGPGDFNQLNGPAWHMHGTVDWQPDWSLQRIVTNVYHLHVH